MTTFYLIRHGETMQNKKSIIQGRTDNKLSDIGRSQIEEVAKKLKEKSYHFDLFIASPLSRAIDSLNIITSYFDEKEIIIEPLVIEREFGAADGAPICEEIYKKIVADEVDNIETSQEIKARAKQFLDKYSHLYPGKTILVLTHSHFIKACFAYLDDNYNFRTKILNASLNQIDYEDGKATFYEINQEIK